MNQGTLLYLKPLEASYTHTHLRRVWDLSGRVFDEANPILPGIFLFGRYLQRYFEKKNQKWSTQKYTQHIWILLAKSFPYIGPRFVSALSFLGEIDFSCAYTGRAIQLYDINNMWTNYHGELLIQTRSLHHRVNISKIWLHNPQLGAVLAGIGYQRSHLGQKKVPDDKVLSI